VRVVRTLAPLARSGGDADATAVIAVPGKFQPGVLQRPREEVEGFVIGRNVCRAISGSLCERNEEGMGSRSIRKTYLGSWVKTCSSGTNLRSMMLEVRSSSSPSQLL
jgi:hypothetical protein